MTAGPSAAGAPQTTLPRPAVVVLVGPAGSGKSTWAAAHFASSEILSSDALRAVLGSDELDLAAADDAFDLIERILLVRCRRGLGPVLDTTGLHQGRRQRYLQIAHDAGVAAVAVVLHTPPRLARQRNAGRERAVPVSAQQQQYRRFRQALGEIAVESWDLVVEVAARDDQGRAAPAVGGPKPPTPDRLRVLLQLSRFDWRPGAELEFLQAAAHCAAQAGLDGLAVLDHLIQIPQVGRSWDPIPDAWVSLGAMAGTEPGLRLGSLVSPVTIRSAATLAKSAATLDVLTGGRAFLGLGLGWWGREHAGFGVALPTAPQRRDQLRRTVETLRALWAPGTKAYAGQTVSLPESTCYPRPVGSLPILVGGRGDATMRLAAQVADGWNLPLSDPDEVAVRLPQAAAAIRAAGRDPDDVSISVLDTPVIGLDPDDVAGQVQRLRGRRSAATFLAAHPAGTVAWHAQRLARLHSMGVREVFLAPLGFRDDDRWTERLAQLRTRLAQR